MNDELKEGDIVYIKYLRFAGTDIKDHRVKGRPYLIYKVIDDNVYLLEIESRKMKPDFYFSKVDVIKNGKKTQRTSYVNMRYILVINIEKLSIAINKMFDKNIMDFSSKISSNQYKSIVNQMNIIQIIKKIEEVNMTEELL